MESKVNLSEDQLLSQGIEDQEIEEQEQRGSSQEQQVSALVAMGFHFLAVQMAIQEVAATGLEWAS